MNDCIGWLKHEWFLDIEEGKVGVATKPCQEGCTAALYGLDEMAEWVTMREVPVTVHMATDCPAYDTDDDGVPIGDKKPMRGYESGSHYIAHGTSCDCNWWPILRVRIANRESRREPLPESAGASENE